MQKISRMKDTEDISNDSLIRSMRRHAISVFMHMEEESAARISTLLLEAARRIETMEDLNAINSVSYGDAVKNSRQ